MGESGSEFPLVDLVRLCAADSTGQSAKITDLLRERLRGSRLRSTAGGLRSSGFGTDGLEIGELRLLRRSERTRGYFTGESGSEVRCGFGPARALGGAVFQNRGYLA
jgi:hypothetical protein